MSKPNVKALEAGMMKRRSPEAQEKNMASSPFGILMEETKDAVSIPVSQIVASPFQCRADIDEEHVESLLDSIGRDGLLSPVVVRLLGAADMESLKKRLETGGSLNDPALDFSQPVYELVIGHHRVEVFRRMRRLTIPASVRHMDDRAAAMALTADNTTHKQLTHWELYKHIEMLERLGVAENNSALARLLNFPRSNVIYLKAFSALPPGARTILDAHPGLIGYKTADALKAYAKSHPAVVQEALEAAANKKIKDTGILSFVERVANPKDKVYHEEQTIKRNGRSVKVTMTEGFTKISHEIDPKKLLAMINEHFDALLRD
jgi:ParB family chromosome partitioning protein